MIHRPRLLAVGCYDARLTILEDYDLWIRLAQQGNSLGVSELIRIAKRYHEGQKFSQTWGFLLAAWKTQLRAILAIDRDYRNFARLALRILLDVARAANKS